MEEDSFYFPIFACLITLTQDPELHLYHMHYLAALTFELFSGTVLFLFQSLLFNMLFNNGVQPRFL